MRGVQQLLQSRTPSVPQSVRTHVDAGLEQDASRAEHRTAPRLGRDFSEVKLHADPQANQTVDALGARALTFGQSVFFGTGQFAPGTPQGRGLIDHEMAHVQQQRELSEPMVQFAPIKGKPGIGARPPEQKVIPMDTQGAEKDFVLFAHDNASLPDKKGKKLLELISAQTDALDVEIHGYASDEGPEEYNYNLSGHRAVAVKRFLSSHLPVGSKVTLFAHGETKDFGVRSKNRRAGVWVGALPAERGFTPRLDLGRYRLGPGPLRRTTLTLPDAPPPPVVVGPVLPPTLHFGQVPRLSDQFVLDWPALAEPGAFRGHRLGARDVAAAEEMGRGMYENLVRLGLGHGVSQWWTNRVLQSAYESRVAFENPNLLDFSAEEMRKFYPDYSETIVPILTPDTLNWVIKATFKKDIQFRF